MSEFEPQDQPVYRVRCRDCANFFPCPCFKHGFCKAYEWHYNIDYVVTVNDECNCFEPAKWYERESGCPMLDVMVCGEPKPDCLAGNVSYIPAEEMYA